MIHTDKMDETVRAIFERWMRVARVEDPKNLRYNHIQRNQVKLMYRHQLQIFFEECDFHVPREKIEKLINENILEFSKQDESQLVEGEFMKNDPFMPPYDDTKPRSEYPLKNRFDMDDCKYLYILLVNNVTVEDAKNDLHEMYQKTIDGVNLCYKADFYKECETGDIPASKEILEVLTNIMNFCEYKNDPKFFDADKYFAIVTIKAQPGPYLETGEVDHSHDDDPLWPLPDGTFISKNQFKAFYPKQENTLVIF